MEDLVADVGDCGLYQRILIPLSMSFTPMVVWSMLFMVFGSKEPDWWAVSRDSLLNQSNGTLLQYTSPSIFLNQSNDGYLQGDGVFSQSNAPYVDDAARDYYVNQSEGGGSGVTFDSIGSWNNPKWNGGGGDSDFSRLLRNGLLSNSSYKNCDSFNSNGGIVFAPGMKTVVVEFNLVCEQVWVVPMSISAQMIGVLFGAFIGGQLGDSIGRKLTIVGMTGLHSVFNLICAFSVTWQMFTVCRTLVGLTIGGLLACSLPYPMEFVGVKWRSVIGSIPTWGIGGLTFSILVWFLPHWSYVHMVTAACMAATLPAWCFLPESVRWLSARGHVTRAHDVLVKMARWNKRSPPSMRNMEEVDTSESSRKYNYYHLFSTWTVAKVSILNGFMWFSCSLTYYGISFGIKNLAGDFNLNFFLQTIVELPPALLVYPTLKCFGRRWTCAGSFFLAALGCFACVVVSLLVSDGDAIINGLCMVAKVGINLGWSAMGVYGSELYPTVVRNLGLGYLNTIARVSGILAPYVLSMNKFFVFYAIVGVFMFFTGVAPLLLWETRGQPLQDLLPEKSRSRSQEKDMAANGHELHIFVEPENNQRL